jgi:hypothetical protein
VIDRIVADKSRLEVEGAERLREIAAGAGPVVFISGHFSNFEMMPAAIVRAGVPCQITPTRKAEHRDPSFIQTEKKKDKIIDRQTRSLKDPSDRIALRVGLLCSEVFNFEGLMVQKIQQELGIPLADIQKFNVKGEVLVYPKSGDVVKIGAIQGRIVEIVDGCVFIETDAGDVSVPGHNFSAEPFVKIRKTP